MVNVSWMLEREKKDRERESERGGEDERERDRKDRRDRERRERAREKKDRDRKFVNLRTPKKTNANPSCVSPAPRPVGSRAGFARKSPIFARNRGLALSLVIRNLEHVRNDSCRTLRPRDGP